MSEARERDLQEGLDALEAVEGAFLLVPLPPPGKPKGAVAATKVLSAIGVGEFLGVQTTTITEYVRATRAGTPKHAGLPFPLPDGVMSRRPYWRLERAQELLDWRAASRRSGAGGGAGKHRYELPRWKPDAPRHAWLPPKRTKAEVHRCAWCTVEMRGWRPPKEACAGPNPKRLATLRAVRRSKAGVERVPTELADKLVAEVPADDEPRITLTPAGEEWLALAEALKAT